MRITLGKFARLCAEETFGPDPTDGLKRALGRYSRALGPSDPTKPSLPEFLADALGATEADSYEVPLSAQAESAFRTEARRRQVPVELLLSHAIFLICARPGPRSLATD